MTSVLVDRGEAGRAREEGTRKRDTRWPAGRRKGIN